MASAPAKRPAHRNPEQIAVLLRELDDDRLARWLFAGSGILAVKRPPPAEPEPGLTRFEQIAAAASATVGVLLHLIAEFDPAQPEDGDKSSTEDLIDQALAALLAVKLAANKHALHLPAAPSADQHDSFGPLVGRVLLTEKGLRLRDLAESLGLRYHALRERIIGSTPFSPNDLRHLFRLYPEPRLADYLLRETSYIAMPLPVVVDTGDSYSSMQAGLLSLREFVTLLGEVWHNAAAPQTTLPETITAEVDEVLRHLVILRWSATHIGRQAHGRTQRASLLRGVVEFADRAPMLRGAMPRKASAAPQPEAPPDGTAAPHREAGVEG